MRKPRQGCTEELGRMTQGVWLQAVRKGGRGGRRWGARPAAPLQDHRNRSERWSSLSNQSPEEGFCLEGYFPSCCFFNKFIYFWLRWVFVAVRRLSLVAGSGGYSLLWCAGFSSRWLLLLRSLDSRLAGSVVVARGLSSCGSRAQ